MQKLKQIYRWIFNGQGVLGEICTAFAIVTVINSVMMIVGLDTPKQGQFAYVHLLIRLAIISLIFALWDWESTISDLRRYAADLRQPRCPSFQRVCRFILSDTFDASCMIFTPVVILICVITILGVSEPTGGPGFYLALVLLYGLIWILIVALMLVDKARRLANGRRDR
ncbi:hypothetical protein [Rhodophyticola porphyridii]|uniref:Uncharacterized protein n=1 Tax=Rhodophyticola porphyridii TaxID=1852017 RepID=A0A3L9Y9N3_9RHOB|nr:hypothetical protein [Rhodophyticola porphyridii]RMA42953.1 hypothetical protein D9R08_04700 [Rhodophyticola porphyridii]